MPFEIDVAVISACVIDLDRAREIARGQREVTRAGMYYSEDPLSTKLCAEGRNLLYGPS